MGVTCDYCNDTGHAGGNLDDPNDCGFCERGERARRIARRERIEHERGNPTPLLGALMAEILG